MRADERRPSRAEPPRQGLCARKTPGRARLRIRLRATSLPTRASDAFTTHRAMPSTARLSLSGAMEAARRHWRMGAAPRSGRPSKNPQRHRAPNGRKWPRLPTCTRAFLIGPDFVPDVPDGRRSDADSAATPGGQSTRRRYGRRRPPIVEQEDAERGELAKYVAVGAIGAGQGELVEKSGCSAVAVAIPFVAGLRGARAGEEAPADAGSADQRC